MMSFWHHIPTGIVKLFILHYLQMSKVEEMATVRMDINVNYTQLLAENDRFTKLLSDIISNPPEITIFWSDPEEDMKLLLEQLEDFANFTMSGFGDQQITS